MDYKHNGIDYLHLGKVLHAKAIRGENVGNFHPRTYAKAKQKKVIDYTSLIFGSGAVNVFSKL